MKTNFQRLLITVAALIFFFQLSAQERIIHGTVTAFDSIAIIGAIIKVHSTKQIVLSDSLGNFSVGCNEKDKLKISAGGFYNQNIKLNSKTKFVAVNIKLKPGEKNREYAIGYGHVTDGEKLAAVSSMNHNDVDFSMYSNMYELIRGRFAGVEIRGGDIIVRGVNSINSSSAALIIVDGVSAGSSILNSIPPVQVKSIDILKDGNSAIYGSRGANGVVLIETKKGAD